ncbi:MAG: hypothetical protein DHS20C17_26460 [Cyclobacteriaceae bacterium]|nr:MAG: hypothetical protein DHS20C17_26460 [Cyclobacteriaceae bacterium]
MSRALTTEQRIKEAAKKVFISKGLAGARMQEIADEAQINKAMLHYYYRNKQQLFKNIFDEVIAEFAPKIMAILGEELSLEEKVNKFVGHYLDLLRANPFIPLFLFSELRNQPHEVVEKVGIKRGGVLKRLEKQLKKEAQAGRIKPITPIEFIANLVSLTVFPFLAQPMLGEIFGLKDKEFEGFIEQRKVTIPEFIMSAINLKH